MNPKPTRIITTCPTVAFAKPVYVQKSARLFPKKFIKSPILFNNYEVITFKNRVSLVDVDGSNLTVLIRIDIVFHLHGFQYDNGLSFLYSIAYIHFDVEDNTRQQTSAGNNQKKTRYIMESIKAGYHVLADKPLAINPQDFKLLTEAYQLAKEKNLLLYDLMTERYDILNIIEKELLHQTELFGDLQKGSPDNPSVIMESVHHFFKTVSGKPLIRPAWSYDVEQQGEGIADVTTHLIDLINWQCFPDKTIHYQSDVTVNAAKHWATPITLAEFSQSTQVDSFPAYLNRYIKNDVLEVMANGSLNYTVKGICIGMKVTWNYTPPTNGGDTFTSIKKGSKATLKIVQDEKNGFVKELYIQKEPDIDNRTFEAQLQKTVEQLQITYPFLSVKNKKNGTYLIDIPQEKRLGHEEHFSKVAKAFLHYVHNQDMPEWENENTLAKYYITTTAVEMAKKGNK